MMYLAGGGYEMTEEYNYDPFVLELPQGNYTGPQMAAAIQELLNGFNVTFDFEVLYHPARGTITIEANLKIWIHFINSTFQVILV